MKRRNKNQPPYEWFDSQGNGLTIDDMDALAHNLIDNPERIEHEAIEAARVQVYMEWGKFLVDNQIVTDWPKEEGPSNE
jgi:hypothetical protein